MILPYWGPLGRPLGGLLARFGGHLSRLGTIVGVLERSLGVSGPSLCASDSSGERPGAPEFPCGVVGRAWRPGGGGPGQYPAVLGPSGSAKTRQRGRKRVTWRAQGGPSNTHLAIDGTTQVRGAALATVGAVFRFKRIYIYIYMCVCINVNTHIYICV